jgi:hypothetical protein
VQLGGSYSSNDQVSANPTLDQFRAMRSGIDYGAPQTQDPGMGGLFDQYSGLAGSNPNGTSSGGSLNLGGGQPSWYQQPQTGGMHPYQPPQFQQPTPTQNPSAMLQNTQNVASWGNPMGMQQAQMQRIGMNPQGSAQGGYFDGNRYVPNVGNQKNGLDDLARWGMNWNGTSNGPVGPR